MANKLAKSAMKDISKTVKMILAIALASLLIALSADRAVNPIVTGDGSEYIAQSLAITRKEGVYIQPQTRSWNAYSRLYKSGHVTVSPENLSKAFTHLCKPESKACDYNHFWFYSLITSLTGGIILGLNADTTPYWFATTNLLILACGCFLTHNIAMSEGETTKKAATKKYEEWISVLSFILLSGIPWWISLAHTEVFTFSLIMPAGLMLTKRRYTECALMFAVASTQNFFWAPITVGLLAIGFSGKRIDPLNQIRWTKQSVSAGFLSIAILALHPTYYWLSHGLITPQQGLGIEKGIKTIAASLSFLIDPSNGIVWYTLSIWCVIGLGALVATRRSMLLVNDGKSRKRFMRNLTPYYMLLATIIFVILSCSQTANFNSGATYGPARYGLLIIALCYPFYRLCLIFLLSTKQALAASITGGAASFVLTGNIPWDHEKPENYLSRTPLDHALPSRLQILLREPETFIERSLGKEGYPTMDLPFGIYSNNGQDAIILTDSKDKAQSLVKLLSEGKKIDLMAYSGRLHCPKPERIQQESVSFFLWGRRLAPHHKSPESVRNGVWAAVVDSNRIRQDDVIEGYSYSSPLSFHSAEEWGRWAAKQEISVSIPDGARKMLISTSGVFNSNGNIKIAWQKRRLLGRTKLLKSMIIGPDATNLISIPQDANRLLITSNGGGKPSRLYMSSRDTRYLTIGFRELMFICSPSGD